MINNKICGLLGLARRAGKLTFGTEACLQEIDKNRVNLIIIATDAAERTKMNFNNICKERKVPIFEVLDIESISKSIGQTNKAVIGIKDKNFAKEIAKRSSGGEAIG